MKNILIKIFIRIIRWFSLHELVDEPKEKDFWISDNGVCHHSTKDLLGSPEVLEQIEILREMAKNDNSR